MGDTFCVLCNLSVQPNSDYVKPIKIYLGVKELWVFVHRECAFHLYQKFPQEKG